MSWENGQDRRGRRPKTDLQPRFSPHHDLSPTSALSFGKKFSHQLNSTEQVHRPSRTHSPYPRARPSPSSCTHSPPQTSIIETDSDFDPMPVKMTRRARRETRQVREAAATNYIFSQSPPSSALHYLLPGSKNSN